MKKARGPVLFRKGRGLEGGVPWGTYVQLASTSRCELILRNRRKLLSVNDMYILLHYPFLSHPSSGEVARNTSPRGYFAPVPAKPVAPRWRLFSEWKGEIVDSRTITI